MNPDRQIAFGYSTTCNIKCDHCVAHDDATQNVKMDFQTAESIVAKMAGSNVTGISFTAGEPLLFFNDICKLIRICKDNRIYSRVVTNGFWAKNPEHSDHTVSELKLNGLSQLRISYSRWHQENVSQENILNAALSCQRQDLNYFISFITDFSKEDDRFEQFLRKNNLKFFPEPLIYFGRAETFTRPDICSDYQPNTCAMNPYLSPELDMFACCDAGMHFTNTGFFHMGNLETDSIDALFEKKEKNVLYNFIRNMGLTAIASFIGIKASKIVEYRKCELCEKLFNSPENLALLEKSAESLALWTR
ncbi:MAG: radical SAM protein [Desulfobacterales bacterium]|nr:radical SAM protein [Desulfobacterales bacterium]